MKLFQKSLRKSNSLIVMLVSFCLIGQIIISYNTFEYSSTSETDQSYPNIIPSKSNINSGAITIDNNWTITKSTFSWCTGFGTQLEPYIIDSVDFNGAGTSFALQILNSQVYFIVQNCTFSNAENGIYFQNVANGIFINCSIYNLKSQNGTNGNAGTIGSAGSAGSDGAQNVAPTPGGPGGTGTNGLVGENGKDSVGMYICNSSNLKFTSIKISNITAGNGGFGGNGGKGGPGGKGGDGQTYWSAGYGCWLPYNGAEGGQGGVGGQAGAGGYGGSCVGILIDNSTSIQINNSYISNLQAGAGGTGGIGGTGGDGGVGGRGHDSMGTGGGWPDKGGDGAKGGNGGNAGVSGNGMIGGYCSGIFMNKSHSIYIFNNTIINLTSGMGAKGANGGSGGIGGLGGGSGAAYGSTPGIAGNGGNAGTASIACDGKSSGNSSGIMVINTFYADILNNTIINLQSNKGGLGGIGGTSLVPGNGGIGADAETSGAAVGGTGGAGGMGAQGSNGGNGGASGSCFGIHIFLSQNLSINWNFIQNITAGSSGNGNRGGNGTRGGNGGNGGIGTLSASGGDGGNGGNGGNGAKGGNSGNVSYACAIFLIFSQNFTVYNNTLQNISISAPGINGINGTQGLGGSGGLGGYGGYGSNYGTNGLPGNVGINGTLGSNGTTNIPYGFLIHACNTGLIYKNAVFLTNNNDSSSNVAWNNTYLGNYWAHYPSLGAEYIDSNADDIGDTPFLLNGTAGSYDYMPLWNYYNIPNSPPVITECSLRNDPMYNKLDMALIIQTSDPDFHNVKLYIDWWVDSVFISSATNKTTLTAGNFTKGQTVKVQITPWDGKTNGTMVEIQRTILNNLPVVIGVTHPLPPFYHNNDLVLSNIEINDIDNDLIFFNVEWYINGQYMDNLKNRTIISHTEYEPGQNILVKLIPFDGEQNGSAYEYSWSILNRAPVLQDYTLGPFPLSTLDDVSITNINATDPDNDVVSLIINWYVNDKIINSATNKLVLNHSNYAFSDRIKVVVTAWDGYTWGNQISKRIDVTKIGSTDTPEASDSSVPENPEEENNKNNNNTNIFDALIPYLTDFSSPIPFVIYGGLFLGISVPLVVWNRKRKAFFSGRVSPIMEKMETADKIDKIDKIDKNNKIDEDTGWR